MHRRRRAPRSSVHPPKAGTKAATPAVRSNLCSRPCPAKPRHRGRAGGGPAGKAGGGPAKGGNIMLATLSLQAGARVAAQALAGATLAAGVTAGVVAVVVVHHDASGSSASVSATASATGTGTATGTGSSATDAGGAGSSASSSTSASGTASVSANSTGSPSQLLAQAQSDAVAAQQALSTRTVRGEQQADGLYQKALSTLATVMADAKAQAAKGEAAGKAEAANLYASVQTTAQKLVTTVSAAL